MLLEDLVGKIPSSSYYELCKAKLSSTLVRYKGWWWWCEISTGNVDKEKPYGRSADWIFLTRQRKDGEIASVRLKQLQHIDIEPVWPKAGSHYCHHEQKHYKIEYNQAKSYKAGLSSGIFNICAVNGDKISMSGHTIAYLLNAFELGKYPTLKQAVSSMVQRGDKEVPLTHNMTLGIHPFVNGPVIYYGAAAIAHVDEDCRIHPSPGNTQMTEYLKHIGEIV